MNQNPVSCYGCLVWENCWHVMYWVFMYWGLYMSISLPVCAELSPTSRLIPSLTLLSGYSLRLCCLTHAHTQTRLPALKKVLASAQYILAVWQPYSWNITLQCFWTLHLPRPYILCLSLLSAVLSACLCFIPPLPLSVQPLSPTLLISVSFQYPDSQRSLAMPQPSSSISASQNQILASESQSATFFFNAPYKPEIYTWITFLVECSASVHTSLIYPILLTHLWVLDF